MSIVTRYASIIRQVIAVAAVVIGSLNDLSLPGSVRAALVIAGSVILAAEHVLAALMDPATSINVSSSIRVPSSSKGSAFGTSGLGSATLPSTQGVDPNASQ